MATEPQVSPGEETQIPAPEVVEETTEVTTPETVEAKTEEVSEEDETQKSIKRLQRRIDKRTADVYRSRAENEQLKAELERLRAGQTEEKPEPREFARDDVERLSELKAEAKLFAKTAEQIVESGKKLEPKFTDLLNDLRTEVGDFVQPNGLPSPFMKAVLDISENPTKLMLHLAKNPDVAGDLADLPVTKLAARLDRIERSLAEPTPKQSSAPKPLEPVKSKSSDSGLHGNLSTEEWMKRREAEVRERRKY
jgi:hypothetical protein